MWGELLFSLTLTTVAPEPVVLTIEQAPEVALSGWREAQWIISLEKCSGSFKKATGKLPGDVRPQAIVLVDLNKVPRKDGRPVAGTTRCLPTTPTDRILIDVQEILTIPIREVALVEIHEWVHLASCGRFSSGLLSKDEMEAMADRVERACKKAASKATD